MSETTKVDMGAGDDRAMIQWTTIGGDTYTGVVVEVEEGVAVVDCTDGVRRAVELD